MRPDRENGAARHQWDLVVLLACVLGLGVVRGAAALELTGVLLLPVTLEGAPLGPAWHTTTGDDGRPLGLALSTPTGLRQAPLLNGGNGEIDVSLLNVVDIAGLWQCLDNEFPPAMVMNLYFNGDNVTPGIGAIIASNTEPSAFLVNRSPRTVSLQLAEVVNHPALLFDDGTLQVALSAAFYFSSTGLASRWRTSLFENLDRVGVDQLAPDGVPDGVVVFELTVGPSSTPPAPLPPRAHVQVAPLAIPAARVGEDVWVGATPNAPPPAAATPLSTPAVELSDAARTPTAAQTADLDGTPTMPTTGSLTPRAGVPSTPTPAQTGSRTMTPGTPTPATGTPQAPEPATPVPPLAADATPSDGATPVDHGP